MRNYFARLIRQSPLLVALVSTLIKFLQPGNLLDNRADHPVYRMFWDMATPDSFEPLYYPSGKMPEIRDAALGTAVS